MEVSNMYRHKVVWLLVTQCHAVTAPVQSRDTVGYHVTDLHIGVAVSCQCVCVCVSVCVCVCVTDMYGVCVLTTLRCSYDLLLAPVIYTGLSSGYVVNRQIISC